MAIRRWRFASRERYVYFNQHTNDFTKTILRVDFERNNAIMGIKRVKRECSVVVQGQGQLHDKTWYFPSDKWVTFYK